MTNDSIVQEWKDPTTRVIGAHAIAHPSGGIELAPVPVEDYGSGVTFHYCTVFCCEGFTDTCFCTWNCGSAAMAAAASCACSFGPICAE